MKISIDGETTMMTIDEFLVELAKTKTKYTWGLRMSCGSLFLRAECFAGEMCPLTAVIRNQTGEGWSVSIPISGAVKHLGLSSPDAEKVMCAADDHHRCDRRLRGLLLDAVLGTGLLCAPKG